MRILILQDDFPPRALGGAGMVSLRLAQALQKKGHEIFVITCVQNKDDVGTDTVEGITIFKIFSKYHSRWRAYISLYNYATVGAVRKIIADVKPGVVHAHNIHEHLSYYCLRIAKQSGAKVFLTAHDVMLFNYGKLVEFIDLRDFACPKKFDYYISALQQIKKYRLRYNPLRNFIIRRYLTYVDKIIAVSEALKEALTQNGIRNVLVIHNGIDVTEWPNSIENTEKFKVRHGLVGKKVILFCGRLSAAKGGEQAIRMMSELVSTVPEAVLLVAGDINEYAKAMLEKARSSNLDARIIFTGWLSGEELKSAYASSDVVLVPSICFDSFPTVVLEAMACKKPVVASCFGGAYEAVTDEKSGYIVNPFDVTRLANKIVLLVNNPENAFKFGQEAFADVQKKFCLENVVEMYIELYPSI